ncbi:MAG: hypothetical protein IKT72_01135 [Clostridia bacterium]|nr:hypothetical protein [Clostridia bacterium]
MFKLKKIIGGRTNVPEIRTIKVNSISSEIAAGTPISIYHGGVRPMDENVDYPATHIVVCDVKRGDTILKVYDILPGMVFSVDCQGDPTTYKIYEEHAISNGSLLSRESMSWKSGAVVYETPEVGDKEVLVTFPCAY